MYINMHPPDQAAGLPDPGQSYIWTRSLASQPRKLIIGNYQESTNSRSMKRSV